MTKPLTDTATDRSKSDRGQPHRGVRPAVRGRARQRQYPWYPVGRLAGATEYLDHAAPVHRKTIAHKQSPARCAGSTAQSWPLRKGVRGAVGLTRLSTGLARASRVSPLWFSIVAFGCRGSGVLGL
jgi:hypothetical protein